MEERQKGQYITATHTKPSNSLQILLIHVEKLQGLH